jgi:hypothetical protein
VVAVQQTMVQLLAESVVQAAVEMVASVAVLHQLQVQLLLVAAVVVEDYKQVVTVVQVLWF